MTPYLIESGRVLAAAIVAGFAFSALKYSMHGGGGTGGLDACKYTAGW